MYFVKDQMKILKETISNYADRMVKVKKLWQKLPIREKERYKGQIQANMEKYSNDLKKWFKVFRKCPSSRWVSKMFWEVD